ncbi:hypothetical protein CANARDRAFT_27220 [[Candida] arabinofermentans NRRL YB-2248]|uniref:Uncharacterized protein n=1 Tax=[Candida] arabinofermentans NRRL YB-2248 TaxID=983967 RepID=A0A1E4T597_9ASCO|nr:hypothetical protein CANARDRAFT_27220 [[Candida] arabinofermentans NRRL YB-2248]
MTTDEVSEESFADAYKRLNEAEMAASHLERLLDQIESQIDSFAGDAEELAKMSKNSASETEDVDSKITDPASATATPTEGDESKD